jgi:hypothetical protein
MWADGVASEPGMPLQTGQFSVTCQSSIKLQAVSGVGRVDRLEVGFLSVECMSEVEEDDGPRAE